MKFLIIDGNSIVNRAFYGIRLLSTKDGRFTNGIYGFLTIFIKLREMLSPDAVAIAFDLKAPTFRHKLYKEYKAGRKSMPPELLEQMPTLKNLLTELGYKVVEKEGFEADDILGTLSKNDECYIATGDRDSLQLVGENTKVLLASTKAGQPQTTVYDADKIMEEYFVSPSQLIDVKALMGDSSDNVPGAKGIGQKTACDLISRFGSIENLYDNIDSPEIRDSVRNKLIASKDSVFLSKTLVTIMRDVPIDTDINSYIPSSVSPKAVSVLRSLELFKIIERLGLQNVTDIEPQENDKSDAVSSKFESVTELDAFFNALSEDGKSFFILTKGGMLFNFRNVVSFVSAESAGFSEFQKKLFTCETVEKITDDAKLVHKTAMSQGYEVMGKITDISLQGYLLNPSAPSYETHRLLQEYGVMPPPVEDCPDEFSEAAQTVSGLSVLSEKLSALISENAMEKLLYEIEMPLCEVLADMELSGFLVDAQGIENFGNMLSERIDSLQNEIYSYAGENFNINSPKQLGDILFVKLGIHPPKKTKTGFSTNANVLQSLRNTHPIVESILQYRQLTKLKSTYCDGLLKVIEPDGRIRSTLNQTETRTGRISSAEPNLQNIPVRSELGREMRKFFMAKEGCVLVDADYSQIELRVLADISDDKNMIDAFNKNEDIHAITASEVFRMPPAFVTHEMRSRAKAVNFGIVYGIGAFSLSKDIGVTVKQADEYIKNYLSHYSGINSYMNSVVERAKELGYAETKFGRRRYLPELSSSNFQIRTAGERIAKNMPIQGTAADIMKIAMVKVYKALKSEGLSARLIMQVHDELIVEAPQSESERAAEILDREMENAVDMKVRLAADVNIGKTWYDAKN